MNGVRERQCGKWRQKLREGCIPFEQQSDVHHHFPADWPFMHLNHMFPWYDGKKCVKLFIKSVSSLWKEDFTEPESLQTPGNLSVRTIYQNYKIYDYKTYFSWFCVDYSRTLWGTWKK